MPVDPAEILGVVFGVPGAVLALFMILRFKLKKKELEMRGHDPELGPEVDALREDLNDTRAQLAEMQERLDFTERVLAAGRASQKESG
ncbi:MAG: hypothetical protein ACE5FJ_08155 [Gemmatimonadales bacterium]